MASEVKRPVRPFRRKSDIPLNTDRAVEDETQLQGCNEVQMTCKLSADYESSEKSAKDPVIADEAGDKLGDCSLKIVQEDSASLPAVKPISRPVRPKERHRTLSSQFPELELRGKNEKQEIVEQEVRQEVMHMLAENQVSALTPDSAVLSKPLVKPKPSLHSLRMHGVNQDSHCSGFTDPDAKDTASQKSDLQYETGLEIVENKASNLHSSDKQSLIEKRKVELISDNSCNDSGQVILADENQWDETSQQDSSKENCVRTDVVKEYPSNSSHEVDRDVNTAKQEGTLGLTVDADLSSLPQLSTTLSEMKVDMPVYAKVNRTKKLKNASSCDSDTLSSSQLKTISESIQQTSDLINTDTSPLDANVTLVPPKKPPRTFAHNEYLRQKTAKNERCSSGKLATESLYEEIEQPVLRNDKSVSTLNTNSDQQSNRNSFCQADNAELKMNDTFKRRSTGDKLPAPPRPPPPSIVQKTGTLPLKKTRELSPGFEPFQRGAANFRNSDRGFWEKRKSKSPESKKHELPQKKSSEKKSKAKQPHSEKLSLHGKMEEDIYAEPDALISALPNQSSVESPIDDPLYEVPGLTQKPQIPAAPSSTGRGTLQPLRQAPLSCASMTGPQQMSKTSTDTRYWNQGGKGVAMQPMQAKISSAYSILRLNVESADTHSTPETVEEDSDSEVTKDEQERRLKHISNVRKRTSHLVANYVRVKLKEPNPLFNFALIVGLRLDENKKCSPTVLFQYPEKLSDGVSSDRVELFCFPDAEIWRPVTIYDGEMFSFVLTDQLGMRQYGYCRRLLPSGSGNRLPAALCIVSPISEACMYEQLLCSVEDRFRVSEEHAQDLLRAAYSHLCPEPNKEVFIVTGPDCRKQPLIIRRSVESCPGVVSCDSLLSYLSTNVLIKVFGSILLERHIIFCAQKLSSLTSCAHTILSLLYPFEWQHIFIPVLPSCLTDILDSPTPYVIGILSSTYARLLQNEALGSEILVVDLDGGSLLRCYGDEEHIIPKKLQKALSTALKDDCDSTGVRDAAVTEAFLRFFIETCGHYTDFISTHQDGKLEFDVDQFTNAVASRSIQMFLEWFVRTQMFEVFITEELHGMKHDHFLSRIMEYREEMTEMTSSLKQNMKMMRKKIKHFFVESSGKLRRKFQRNVFI